MQDFRNLQVWHKAHLLTMAVYDVTRPFPKDEMFGLTSQMRRAAASVPMNLAEGCGRDSRLELARYSQIAMGSASELECQLLLAFELGYMADETYRQINLDLVEIKRMLNGFIQSLRKASG